MFGQRIYLCRSCVGNLLAAADGIQTGEVELTRQLSAQRAGRCMQLLQDMIRACKVTAPPMFMPNRLRLNALKTKNNLSSLVAGTSLLQW